MLPLASQATATTLKPAMTALAGLVPWAETGIRHTLRRRLAAALVIGADGQQPRVLALRARVGLQGDGGEAGDLGQPGLEVGEDLRVALRLLRGRERMQLAELRPGDGQHLRGRVQLHRAGAERDHRGGEREVARLQPVDVAQHLRLGVVAVEDLVGQVRAGCARRAPGTRARRRPASSGANRGARPANTSSSAATSAPRRRLVQGDAQRPVAEVAQVHAPLRRAAPSPAPPRPRAGARAGCRRTGASPDVEAEALQPRGQARGQRVDARRDGAQPVGPVVHGVHAGHDRQQHLRGADVARGLVAADVLLAGLQREAVRGAPVARPCDTPTMRPGIWRLWSSRVDRYAACGPPKPRGTPKRCVEPTAMSAPNSPGGRSSVSARRSAATTTSAPAACARSASGA